MDGERPILETERLILTPMAESDIDDLVAMDGDQMVMHFIRKVRPEPARRAFWRRMLDDEEAHRRGLGWWTVREKAAPEVILGGVFLLPFRNEICGAEEIELGYRYVRAAWGRGIATEAGRALAHHGLADLGFAELMASVEPKHLASQRVLAKIGFRDAGETTYHGQRVIYLLMP